MESGRKSQSVWVSTMFSEILGKSVSKYKDWSQLILFQSIYCPGGKSWRGTQM